ncbi:MAG TPA: hypothetical protein PK416_08285 [Thermodesulfobacteriota bacterium]|nr:hypothetical protein [Thermodesulfobacteriota bacterium]
MTGVGGTTGAESTTGAENTKDGNRNEAEQEATMRAVPVYRVDYVGKTKEPIGVVFEKRKTERAANYSDLLRLARRLFAVDAADAVHIMIDMGESRRAIMSEVAGDCSAR